MIVAGIDIGFPSTEAIVFDDEKGIPGYSIITIAGSLGVALLALNGISLERSRLSVDLLDGLINKTRFLTHAAQRANAREDGLAFV